MATKAAYLSGTGLVFSVVFRHGFGGNRIQRELMSAITAAAMPGTTHTSSDSGQTRRLSIVFLGDA